MTIAVLFADGFEEVEAITPVDYLRRSGITVLMVSCAETKNVTGSHGITVLADITAADLTAVAQTLDGIVIPGGMPGAAHIAACKAAVDAVDSVWQRNGVVAAICAAPVVVLGKTGILKNKQYTCFPGVDSDMAKWAGPLWQELTAGSRKLDSRCVIDNNLITAAGPGAAEEFSVALVRTLAGTAAAEKLIKNGVLRNV